MEQSPVARMSKRAGAATIPTLRLQDGPFGEESPRRSRRSGQYKEVSKGSAKLMAKNIMNVMNQGFWNTCSFPSKSSPFSENATFMVIVFRDPHTRSATTAGIVYHGMDRGMSTAYIRAYSDPKSHPRKVVEKMIHTKYTN
mmetsp:Transcript_86724/g.190354  ORF Transcript_86724/g.190354 Transcript_86724/m.190354 type:complete len:141 (+) Transcript_86724:919-1341(+)